MRQKKAKNNNNDENNMKDDGDPVKDKNNNVKYNKKYHKMYIKYNKNSNINNKIKITTTTKVELYKKQQYQMTKRITTTKATKVTKTTANTRNDILLQHNLQPFKCNNNFKPLKRERLCQCKA